jgi:vacuolar-type H+-ATPase subunit E/Vma4
VTLDDRLRAALDRALADVRAAAQAEMDEVRQSVQAEVDEIRQSAQAEMDEVRQSAQAEVQSAVQSSADLRASAERLSDCVQALDEAPSLGAVLTVLSGCARLEAGRAGIILVREGTLSAYPSRAEVPPEQGRLAISAAERRAPVIEADTAAFPIALGGHVVAVLSTGTPSSPEVVSTLDLLARHAARVLEAMTIGQITGLAPPGRPSDASAGSAP